LGKGAHGEVFLFIRESDKKKFAIKHMDVNYELMGKLEDIVGGIMRLNSAFIVNYEEGFRGEDGSHYFVMPYYKLGTLTTMFPRNVCDIYLFLFLI
jgi:serine/threonine protein kinase